LIIFAVAPMGQASANTALVPERMTVIAKQLCFGGHILITRDHSTGANVSMGSQIDC
jgi:hypothetical protein